MQVLWQTGWAYAVHYQPLKKQQQGYYFGIHSTVWHVRISENNHSIKLVFVWFELTKKNCFFSLLKSLKVSVTVLMPLKRTPTKNYKWWQTWWLVLQASVWVWTWALPQSAWWSHFCPCHLWWTQSASPCGNWPSCLQTTQKWKIVHNQSIGYSIL